MGLIELDFRHSTQEPQNFSRPLRYFDNNMTEEVPATTQYKTCVPTFEEMVIDVLIDNRLDESGDTSEHHQNEDHNPHTIEASFLGCTYTPNHVIFILFG